MRLTPTPTPALPLEGEVQIGVLKRLPGQNHRPDTLLLEGRNRGWGAFGPMAGAR